MLTLPDVIIPLLQPFSKLFQHRTWVKSQVLLVGAMIQFPQLSRAKRVVHGSRANAGPR